MHLLAKSVGRALAEVDGLVRGSFPPVLGPAFLVAARDAANAFREDADYAHLVSASGLDGAISAGKAIELRSRDDGKTASALLLSLDGDFKELSSLETFKLANRGSLPSGVADVDDALLDIEALAGIAADVIAAAAGAAALDTNTLQTAILSVARLLADAYRELGNDEISWTAAWWDHLRRTIDDAPSCADALAGAANCETLSVYLAAGLPFPDELASATYAKGHDGKAYAKVVRERWSSTDDIIVATGDIARIEAGVGGNEADHPILDLDWDAFATTQARARHPILAACYHDRGHDRWKAGWARVPEHAYFAAHGDDDLPELQIEVDVDGERRLLPTAPGVSPPLFVHPAPTVSDVSGKKRVSLGEVSLALRLPLAPGADAPDLDVSTRPKSISLELRTPWQIDDEGLVRAKFELTRSVGTTTWKEKPVAISIRGASSAATVMLRGEVAVSLYLPCPARPSMLLLEQRGKAGAAKVVFHSDTKVAVDSGVLSSSVGEPPMFKISRSARGFQALLVTAPGRMAPLHFQQANVTVSRDVPEWPNVALSEPCKVEDGELECDGFVATLMAPLESDAKLTPIEAAATGAAVDANVGSSLVAKLKLDPRATLESWLGQCCISAKPSREFRDALGCCILVADEASTSREPVHLPSHNVFADSAHVQLGMPREVSNSDAACNFWNAFDGLGLPGAMPGEGATCDWPSRLDLRGVQRGSVETYLRAYLELLELARAGGDFVLAAYPFSAVLHDANRGYPAGVLLSPLHPLRLGWSWSVQHLAAEAYEKTPTDVDRLANLLRFVDGGDLPALARSPGPVDAMLATPLDMGYEGLFSAWSFLRTSRSISPAKSILGQAFPAGTASGLDQGGVSAAIRDYLRVHPFSQQLSIGLEAGEDVQPSRDLERAVVSAVALAAHSTTEPLPGGARVYDNRKRRAGLADPGEVLHALERPSKALDVQRPSVADTFAWRSSDNARLDIRFLETPLVDAAVVPSDEPSTGFAPALPVGRGFAWRRYVSGESRSAYSPVLDETAFAGLDGYGRCLEAFETLGGSLEVKALVPLPRFLVGEAARWTVSGNAHMDPVTLSRALRDIKGQGLALWEWRPAFLPRNWGSGAAPAGTARPYVVIARAGEQFYAGIRSAAKNCIGDDSPDRARQVLDELGARGVGLSSLLSMGHRQSTGAIGFYLAFKALEQWERDAHEDQLRCILPMDALAPVFEAIVEGVKDTGARRRADLLVVSATRKPADRFSIHLHPVEVKMRVNQPGSFPGKSSQAVTDALEQLSNSGEVLAKLCGVLDNAQPGDVLLHHAIASLLSTAISLRNASSEDGVRLERELLEAAALGRCDFESSAGSLTWFQAGGRGDDDRPDRLVDNGSDAPRIFMLDPVALERPEGNARRDEAYGRIARMLEEACTQGTKPGASREDLDETFACSGQADAGADEGDQEPRVAEPGGAEPDSPGAPPLDSPSSPGSNVLGADSAVSEDAEHAQDARGEAPPTPRGVPGVRVVIGRRRRGLEIEDVVYDPSDTRLNQLNFGIVGDLGTGKTQFVKSLIYQVSLSAAGNRGIAPKFFVFDYKRDYVDAHFIDAVGGQVIDPGETPIPLNFFALPPGASEKDKVRRARFFVDVVDRISSIGQVQGDRLYEAVRAGYAANDAPVLPEVLEAYQKESGKADKVTSTLKLMVDLEIFETDREKLTDFASLFDRTTIVNLQGLKAGNEVRDVVVTLFLDQVYNDYMKSRTKQPYERDHNGVQRRFVDAFLLVDEAHHILRHGFEVLETLMLEGREFGMGVVLSTQFLSHFGLGKVNWAEALSTWSIHKVPNVAGRDLERLGFVGDVDARARDVVALQNHHALFKSAAFAPEGAVLADVPFFELVPGPQ